MMDPILEEAYAVKERLARESGYDIDRMLAHASTTVERLERAGYKFSYLPPPPFSAVRRKPERAAVVAVGCRKTAISRRARELDKAR
jgi:hypothetical protein